MSVQRNARLNPYVIQERNAAEANVVTTHMGRETNSWIYKGDITEKFKKLMEYYVDQPDRMTIDVMRDVIKLFRFNDAFATTFAVTGRSRTEEKGISYGMCFWDSDNSEFYVTCFWNRNRPIELRYQGTMHPDAQFCRLVRNNT
jgi:hypothetical protein